MKVTNQESAENLKEIINHTWEYIEKIQMAYLSQSMKTILDYFDGKVDIITVRKIEMDFLRPCASNGQEQFIIINALEEFRTIYGGKWSMTTKQAKNNSYWNTTYILIKGNKTLRLYAETNFSTNFMVYAS